MAGASQATRGLALIVIDLLETDEYRGSTGYLDFDGKAAKRLAVELRMGTQRLLDLAQENR